MSVPLELARELLDMGARLRRAGDDPAESRQAAEQLRGAVALHNILKREQVAYLADEVGMGKTYVALGAIALFRHFDPEFRVAVIAPRENIQQKWMKEWFNFATHIVRVPDLRMKALHGGPARPLVKCDNLRQFVRETTVNPEREFFLRLSSFSLGTGSDESDLRALRDRFRRELPWIEDVVPSLRNKREFKDSLAKAVCCGIPEFDLLVVDEGHNLKHGFSEKIAARNRVMAFAFGRPSDEVDRKLFKDYGPRAKRVLFLSATPIEDDYRQLWNQLDVVGKGQAFSTLIDQAATETQKREVAQRFLIRRVSSLEVGGKTLTKNLYRREWRRGGVTDHDQPISTDDVRQRLVVALVQKKVAELLNSPRFGASFQMGMLASFESFLETTKVKKADDDRGNFDDAEQTDDELERQGIDVLEINKLASDYRRKFGTELPHPKMDALVERLSRSWHTGRKALVFLRRVASVWEVKERLDLAYNTWLLQQLRQAFSVHEGLARDFDAIADAYRVEREANRKQLMAARTGGGQSDEDGEQDRGGLDTFFAWFFRGEGPGGPWLSGAKFSDRFVESRYELSTFFEDNHAAELLGVVPGDVLSALASAVDLQPNLVEQELTTRARWYLSRAQRPGRREVFEAAQAGAVELLKDRATSGGVRASSDTLWQMRYLPRRQSVSATSGDFAKALEYATLFTELRRQDRAALRSEIWPEPLSQNPQQAVRERELRRELLSTAARRGHTVVDLYVQAMLGRGTLRLSERGGKKGSTIEPEDEESAGLSATLAQRFLDALELQRATPIDARTWSAFDELAEIGRHFDLILDVNDPGVRSQALSEIGRTFGRLLGQQQPVGGMTGQVNRTMVRQFRMPGYPFVLLSTDLLREGEDLHTFCADVYHYGLAWTPSAIEQRIGRVDRVRSLTERTANGAGQELPDEAMLQVFYPHLEDTVERLQVRRVLRRMHEFIRLMHEGLGGQLAEASKLNVAQAMVGRPDVPEPVRGILETSFPVRDRDMEGRKQKLAVSRVDADRIAGRLLACQGTGFNGTVHWHPPQDRHSIAGTATLPSGRTQPFVLHLQSRGQLLTVRCVSHVGRLDTPELLHRARDESKRVPQQFGVIEQAESKWSDLTVEEEVLLGDEACDLSRIAWLVRRVVTAADQLEMSLWPDRELEFEHVREALEQEGRVTEHAG